VTYPPTSAIYKIQEEYCQLSLSYLLDMGLWLVNGMGFIRQKTNKPRTEEEFKVACDAHKRWFDINESTISSFHERALASGLLFFRPSFPLSADLRKAGDVPTKDKLFDWIEEAAAGETIFVSAILPRNAGRCGITGITILRTL